MVSLALGNSDKLYKRLKSRSNLTISLVTLICANRVDNIEIHSALLAHLSCRLNSTAELSSSAYRQPVAPAELRSGDRDES